MRKLLILGCGWVGEYFAEWVQQYDVEIYATVTSEEKALRLRAKGLRAEVYNFDQSASFPFEKERFDFVLNSIPASKKLTVDHIQKRFDQVANILSKLDYGKHVYLSSIGIYPEETRTFDESYTQYDTMSAELLQAENAIQSLANTVIFRLGGLFGKQRIFAKYFAGRVCPSGKQSANFVHVDDVVKLIWLSSTHNLSERLYNVVCPEHPKKELVVRASAHKYGFDLPTAFTSERSYDKVVDGNKLKRELNYTFVYPNPIHF